jgi:hypothetical protein
MAPRCVLKASPAVVAFSLAIFHRRGLHAGAHGEAASS